MADKDKSVIVTPHFVSEHHSIDQGVVPTFIMDRLVTALELAKRRRVEEKEDKVRDLEIASRYYEVAQAKLSNALSQIKRDHEETRKTFSKERKNLVSLKHEILNLEMWDHVPATKFTHSPKDVSSREEQIKTAQIKEITTAQKVQDLATTIQIQIQEIYCFEHVLEGIENALLMTGLKMDAVKNLPAMAPQLIKVE